MLFRSEMKTTMMEALQGLPRRVDQRGGRRRHGGASGHNSEARGSRWLRQRRAAATAALGQRERERQRGRVSERRGGLDPDGTHASIRGVDVAGEAGRRPGGGRTRACAPRAHVPVLLARWRGRLALASRLGRPVGPLGCQVRSPGKLLLLFPLSFCFLSISVIFVSDLVKY